MEPVVNARKLPRTLGRSKASRSNIVPRRPKAVTPGAGDACQRLASELMSDLIFVYDVAADGAASLAWCMGSAVLRNLLRPTCAPAEYWIENIAAQDLAVAAMQQARVLAGQAAVDDMRVVDCDGESRFLRVQVQSETDAAGGPTIRIAGVVRDITAQTRMLRSLGEGEMRLRDFALAASDWFWETDADLRLLGRDDPDCPKSRLIGWLRGRQHSDFWTWDVERQAEWESFREKLEMRVAFRDFQHSVRDPKGGVRHLRSSGKPIFSGDGRFLGYRGASTDVTAEVEASRRAKIAESRLRSAIESLDQVFVLYDKDDRVVLCNRKWRELNRIEPDVAVEGMSFEDITRMVLAKCLIPSAKGREAEWAAERLRRHREAGKPYDATMEDGRWMRITERRTPDGSTVVIRSDIQELVDRERRLKESEQRFKDFAEAASDHFWEQDENFRYTFVRAADGILPEAERARRLGRTRWELANVDPETNAAWRAHRADLLARRAFHDFRYATRDTEGRLRHWRASGKPLFDDSGNFRGYRGVAKDETGEVEALRRLTESERRFKDFAEAASDHFWEQDADLRFTFISADEGRLAEAVPSVLLGKTRWELAKVDPCADAQWRAHRDDLLARRPFRDFSYSVQDKAGRVRYWRVSGKPLFDEHGAFLGYRGVAKHETAEVEERIQREKAEARLADAIESLGEGFAIWDADDRMVLCNHRYREIFSSVAAHLVPGARYREVLEAAARCDIYRMAPDRLKSYIDWRVEVHLQPRGPFTIELGDGRFIELSEKRTREGGIVGIWSDITDRKRLEAQLFQAHKMESLGTLAGGIAHDVNNTLTPIIGLTELALEDLPPDHSVRPSLERVMSAGQRVKALVGQILAFSRQAEPKRELISVSKVVKDAVDFLRATIPATIKILVDAGTDIDCISADATQIHQVVLNLSANAVHAMTPKGGILELAADRVELDAAQAGALSAAMRAGPYVRLAVRDNGHGIDPAILGRIFDPFFTTKPVGEGTGMGLAMVHGIVTAHGGAVRATSTRGCGAIFEVFLPSADEKKSVAPAAEEVP